MIQHSEVIGIDVNFSELQQAARVFHGSKGLQFMYGDIRAGILDKFKFDVILFSASIQYFPSLKNIVEIAAGLLKTGGEIHIMDSHFYKLSESEAAKKRTKAYYDHLGFPEMATYYFHHSLCELHQYNVKMLSKPSRFSRLLPGIRNPFPWICIKNGSLY